MREHIASCSVCQSNALAETFADTASTQDGASVNRRSQPSIAGAHIGRYELECQVGAGGMGTVYLAHDPDLQRAVVIKLIRPDLIAPNDATGAHARLLREAQAMAQLSHRHVAQVYDVGTHDGQVFIAIEYLDGGDLSEWLALTPRPWQLIVDRFYEAGLGLAAAHAAGLVHRDFKPSNIFLDDDGCAKVGDFGVARPPAQDAQTSEHSQPPTTNVLDVLLTETGAIVGTPAFMPPEQIAGGYVDHRSDQFSFCVAMFRSLYGRAPYPGSNLLELAEAMEHGAIRPPTQPHAVPDYVYDALCRGLSPAPEDRFPSMTELLTALRPPQRHTSGKRWLFFLVGAIVIGAIVAVGLAKRGTGDTTPSCSRGAHEVAHTWNTEREQQAAQAFSAANSLGGPLAFETVSQSLHHYANAWAKAFDDSCADTHLRGEQSVKTLELRVRCLQRHRLYVDKFIHSLTNATAEIVTQAPTEVLHLPDLALCSDISRLASLSVPPLGSDINEIRSIEDELANIKLNFQHHEARATTPIMDRLLTRARNTKHHPLIADVTLLAAMIYQRAAKLDKAESMFHDAATAAELGGHHLARAKTYVELVGIKQILGKTHEALRWGALAQAILDRRPSDNYRSYVDLSAELQRQLSVVERDRGNNQRALERARTALDILAQSDHDSPGELGESHSNLADVLFLMRDFDGAYREHKKSRAIWTRIMGANSPRVAHDTLQMAAARHQQGRGQDALKHTKDAIATLHAFFGEGHHELADAYFHHAFALQTTGDNPAAIEFVNRSIALTRKQYSSKHRFLMSELGAAGVVLANAGELEGASKLMEEALALAEELDGANDKRIVTPLNALAAVRSRQKRYQESLQLLQRSYAIVTAQYSPEATIHADTLTRLGALHVRRKSWQAAAKRLEQALAIRTKNKASRWAMSWTKFELAKALTATKKLRGRAAMLAKEARDAAHSDGNAKEVTEIETWMAKHR